MISKDADGLYQFNIRIHSMDIIQGFLSATEYLVELCAQTQEGKIAENDVPNLPEEIGHNVFYT